MSLRKQESGFTRELRSRRGFQLLGSTLVTRTTGSSSRGAQWQDAVYAQLYVHYWHFQSERAWIMGRFKTVGHLLIIQKACLNLRRIIVHSEPESLNPNLFNWMQASHFNSGCCFADPFRNWIIKCPPTPRPPQA